MGPSRLFRGDNKMFFQATNFGYLVIINVSFFLLIVYGKTFFLYRDRSYIQLIED